MTPGLAADWLDPGLTDLDNVRHLLDQLPEPTLEAFEVDRAVGSVRTNGPQLIKPVD